MTQAVAFKFITDKQVKFIKDLAAQRDWSTLEPHIKYVITHVIADSTDNLSTANGSQTIDHLLKIKPNATAQKTNADLFKEMIALLDQIPASRYAIQRQKDKTWAFFELHEFKTTKARRLLQLYGAPNSWNTKMIGWELAIYIAKRILEAGPQNAAIAYAREHGRCAVCNAHLSDPESIAAGIGPVCRQKF